MVLLCFTPPWLRVQQLMSTGDAPGMQISPVPAPGTSHAPSTGMAKVRVLRLSIKWSLDPYWRANFQSHLEWLWLGLADELHLMGTLQSREWITEESAKRGFTVR